MKKENIIFLVFIVLTTIFLGSFICCNSTKTTACVKNKNDTIFVETIQVDTITIIDRTIVDSLSICLAQARDSIRLYRDSISYQNYINARRMEKIKYYISICEKRSMNKKFFYGWIKRTMTE